MLADVKQAILAPLIRSTILPGSLVYTNEYDIYTSLRNEVMSTRACVTVMVCMLVMKTAMGFMKCT
jgi:hypothetical protein